VQADLRAYLPNTQAWSIQRAINRMELDHKVELISRHGNDYVWRAVGHSRIDVPARLVREERQRLARLPRD
jgi:hypothetical protein